MSDEETPAVIQYADDAYESIRSINHETNSTRSLPAPLVYSVLGNLKMVGHSLPQALNQLAAGLGKSLNTHNVYDKEGQDPVQSVATATDHLTRAAALAKQLGEELEKAQSAIAWQGYNEA